MIPKRTADAPHNVGLITFGTMLATIMQALDTTIANVALPHMQGTFSATQDQITWVLTSYIVAAAIMTPPTGWLAARFGRKRLYLVSVAGFTVASVLCAIAMTIDQAVIFRLLQGAFGAALVPLSQATLLDNYPREKHGSAMAIWGLGIMVGPILGPMLGGWLTDNYSWRWVFYINVPVGALAFFVISTFVPETERNSKLSFDVFGFVTLSLAIGAFQMFLDRGESKDWFGSYEVIIELCLAVLAFYLFLVHTFTTDKPFISPSIFRDRSFSASLVLIFIVGIILYATMALMPPFLQNLENYPVVTTGLLLAPRGVGTMIAMLVVGRAMRWIDPRIVLVAGLGLSAYSLYWMEGFSLYISSRGPIIVSGIIHGVGHGLTWVPLSMSCSSPCRPPSGRMRRPGQPDAQCRLQARHLSGDGAAGLQHPDNTPLRSRAFTLQPFAGCIRSSSSLVDPSTRAGGMAAAMVDEEVNAPGLMIAYINDFRLMMIVTLISLPFVLLLSSPKKAGGSQSKEAVVMD